MEHRQLRQGQLHRAGRIHGNREHQRVQFRMGTMQRYYTFADSAHDEVLYLRYNYFSDIGYGTVNECFAASGPSNSLTFSYTSTCTAGDVVVVAQPRVDRLLQHPQLIPYAEPGSSSTMRRSQGDCRAKTWAASFKPAWRS